MSYFEAIMHHIWFWLEPSSELHWRSLQHSPRYPC